MTNSSSRPEIADPIAWFGLLIGIATMWLFVAGWSYVYAYFGRLNISVGLVGAEAQELIVYGALALSHNVGWLLANVVLFLILTYSVLIFDQIRFRLEMIIIGTIVITGFFFAHRAGLRAGEEIYDLQRNSGFNVYNRVAIKPTSQVDSDGLLSALAENECSLAVVLRPDRIILIRPDKSQPGMALRAFIVPMGSIESLSISDARGSC